MSPRSAAEPGGSHLSVLDGPEILYVDLARSFRRGQSKIDLNLRPGSRLSAYCTSMGKGLLANLPAQEQHELIAQMTHEPTKGDLHRRVNRTLPRVGIAAVFCGTWPETPA